MYHFELKNPTNKSTFTVHVIMQYVFFPGELVVWTDVLVNF